MSFKASDIYSTFFPSWDIQVLEAALARARPLSLPHLVFASEAPMPKGKERGREERTL